MLLLCYYTGYSGTEGVCIACAGYSYSRLLLYRSEAIPCPRGYGNARSTSPGRTSRHGQDKKRIPPPSPPDSGCIASTRSEQAICPTLKSNLPFSGVKKRSNGRPGFLANYQPQLLAGNASLLLGLANRLPPPFRRPPSP